jgi:hypothetical protein
MAEKAAEPSSPHRASCQAQRPVGASSYSRLKARAGFWRSLDRLWKKRRSCCPPGGKSGGKRREDLRASRPNGSRDDWVVMRHVAGSHGVGRRAGNRSQRLDVADQACDLATDSAHIPPARQRMQEVMTGSQTPRVGQQGDPAGDPLTDSTVRCDAGDPQWVTTAWSGVDFDVRFGEISSR